MLFKFILLLLILFFTDTDNMIGTIAFNYVYSLNVFPLPANVIPNSFHSSTPLSHSTKYLCQHHCHHYHLEILFLETFNISI